MLYQHTVEELHANTAMKAPHFSVFETSQSLALFSAIKK